MASKISPLPSKLKQFSLSTTQFVSLLESYTNTRSLSKIKQLHAHIISTGILSLSSFKPFTLCSNLASSYALCGHVAYACKLFDELRQPKLFLYNAVIRAHSQSGSPFEVLKLFVDVLSSGYLFPDKFTYPFVIKACGDLLLLKTGVVIHGKVITGGFGSNLFLLNSLLAMYMNCGAVEMARRAFYVMGERDMVSWATMISGLVKNGCANDALVIFDEMIGVGAELNRSAVLSVLSACGDLDDLTFGRKVHGIVEERGLRDDVCVSNALINMYTRCGSMNDAREVFDRIKEKDVVTWTSLMKGYVMNDNARYALNLCRLMHLEKVVPNSVTIAMLLQASGSLQAVKHGRCLHAWVVRRNLFRDAIIETALIDMYVKCNHVCYCFLIFDQSSQKRVASWNAMISAYTYNGLASNAVHCFKQMLHEAIRPDAITFSSLLCGCSDLADRQQAFSVHSYMLKSGFLSEYEVLRGLIDLYSKCGSLKYSQKIFSEVPLECRDITLWGALMAGYGAHGHGEYAVLLFKRMVQSGVKPNEVTFTCVLDACSHAGLVDEGLELFTLMLRTCQINPSIHHYTCMIDLLGRAGRLQVAYDLIITMPFMPNHAVWGSLLGACMAHQNVELGEISAKLLFIMEPENMGNYVLLANIYASAGRWKDAENMRSIIDKVGLRKTPGHSLVEVKVN
ncbi:pentatricopeptide repeat-containing protein At5g39350-like isoform X2 [Chenopodium quinoa]|uniref:pentatricopeptide repeat-containing protein At5g39350-like n=1 Tax=Chenopodium quinoa TaxID=63459 RepID=UPI000B78DF97|nr:pentatricopeptide repeat-containing protein At5g39350-like [Chenopodium quinoa]XP_021751666.1 pentatricopeptide repeat-containing protein At5g39350-like [Chenopodium quinoa]XP_021751667.1 pentatricopeptide repeat-containing protein At5g39350-like [Chenopodium quinoa]XP_021751668.1 pentatricopeptide repeat-containing protein At5g39350-like [Chenopodium quinoa]XP_021770161.1 pentatricopeptide repeat-containing protein At5g39350-like isoform X2 [Chenopodium quinoa]XP_021770170.1 pentatricopept